MAARVPAWKDVSIQRLLNMSSGIPTYSETEAMSQTWAEEPNRTLSAQDLVKLVYPSATNNPPPTTGYHYSNTNYILAGMIAAKAAGKPYRDLVHELLIKPLGLNSTFYEDGPYPAEVVARLAHGYFENPACTDFQPKDCRVSWTSRSSAGTCVRRVRPGRRRLGVRSRTPATSTGGCARCSQAGWCRQSSRPNGCRWSRSRPARRSASSPPPIRAASP